MMIALFPPVILATDTLVVLLAAWLAMGAVKGKDVGRVELALGWGLAAIMLVVASGVLLGASGGLGQPGFLAVHVAVLAGLAVARRSRFRHDLDELRGFLKAGLQTLRAPGSEAWLLGLLVTVGAAMLIVSFNGSPVVFDALTYRLSRVGQWLQDGRIRMIVTDDARLNYMPVAPDIVMAWLLTGSTEGFRAAAVAQTLGGGLALVATVGLARLTGLARSASLAAALLLFGLPNVAPQFTSAYTDLFTTGVLASAFFLWLVALRRGEGSWLGGAGAGLALGAKGTAVYFAPGLLLAAGWLAWRHRASWQAWLKTVLGAVLALTVFVAPSLERNHRTYGGWLGPADFVVWHHGHTPGWKGSIEKLRLNLASAFAQLCEPNSQPPWWRSPVRSMGEFVVRDLPEQDAYAFDGLNRRANLEKVYAVAAPDADVTSTGLLLPLLGLLAAGTAVLKRRTAGGELALVWAVALAGLVLFIHWRVQWSPYLFRFLVLAAPWLAVLVAWWIELLPRGLRLAGWTLLALTGAQGFGAAMLETYQSGWPAYARPGQSFGYYLYEHWRTWSAQLDQGDAKVRPALPMNLPLAAFYRQQPARVVEPMRFSSLAAGSAEELTRAEAGWVVVPAAHFMGREGRVMGRLWLHEGDANNAFSLAAYRALRDGERPQPLLYRNRYYEAPGRRRHELLIRAWDREPVRLELANRGGTTCRFTLRTALGAFENEIGPGKRLWIEVNLPTDAVTAVYLEYPPADSPGKEPVQLGVNLLP